MWHSPLSTLVIDIPRRGVLIARKHSDVVRNFIKLRFSPSLSSFRIAAAFRSISEDLHDDVDEFCESRLDFLMQMQLLSILRQILFRFHRVIWLCGFIYSLILQQLNISRPYITFSIVIGWKKGKYRILFYAVISIFFICCLYNILSCVAFIVEEKSEGRNR